jgi:hypothetical protein
MIRICTRFRWLALLLALVVQPALAEVDIIDLRHQPAEQIIPALREVAPEGAAITGTGFQIIVRAEAGDIAVVRELVRGLDQPVETLQISVRQVGADTGLRQGTEGGVRIGGGTASGSVRIYRSEDARSDRSVHSIRVQDGQSAWIDTGGTELVATDRLYALDARDGAAFGERRVARDWQDGFFVRPQRHGDQVTLSIEVVRETPLTDEGTAPRRELVTTVTAPLGEWVRIGGVDSSSRERDRRILFRTRDLRTSRSAVEIRVDAPQ